MTYRFTKTGKTVVRGDGAVIPWDVVNNRPIDIEGYVGREWRMAGSPAPLPYSAPFPSIMDVDIERDKRLKAGIVFNGVLFNSDEKIVANVLGLAVLANMATAVGNGAAGNMRWAHPNFDFAFTAADNSSILMDAPTLLNFARAMATRALEINRAARLIKADVIAGVAVNVETDPRWPA